MFTCNILGSKSTRYVPFHIMKYPEHIYFKAWIHAQNDCNPEPSLKLYTLQFTCIILG